MKASHFFTGLVLFSLHFQILAEPVGIDPDRLEKMVQEQDALVIDVRTPTEWKQTGTIPSSRTIMFFDENGDYDADQWLTELQRIQKPGQPVILVCRSGRRSAKVGEFLDRTAGMKNVYNLEKGISGWIQQGKATAPCGPESC